jgi:hypothetical protein
MMEDIGMRVGVPLNRNRIREACTPGRLHRALDRHARALAGIETLQEKVTTVAIGIARGGNVNDADLSLLFGHVRPSPDMEKSIRNRLYVQGLGAGMFAVWESKETVAAAMAAYDAAYDAG